MAPDVITSHLQNMLTQLMDGPALLILQWEYLLPDKTCIIYQYNIGYLFIIWWNYLLDKIVQIGGFGPANMYI